MENASNGLKIAAAVIIVIILISLALLVLNMGQGIFDQTGEKMTDQEVKLYNQDFKPYEGRQRGSSVRSLIALIVSHNGNSNNVKIDFKSEVTGNTLGQTNTITSISSFSAEQIVPSKTYTVTFGYNTDGRINLVTIK